MAIRTAAKESRKRTVKKLKDVNAPKAPLTPYLRFGAEQRKRDPAVNSLPVGQQGKILSEMWKNCSEEEKEKLKAEYAVDKQKYVEEFEAYKQTDSYKDWLKRKEALEVDSVKKKKKNSQSAYNVYFKEQYPSVAAKNKELAMKDVGSEVAKQWKAMSEEDKKVYKEKAEKINKEAKENEMPSKVEEENSEEEEEETDEE
jgi:hypothetical protein